MQGLYALIIGRFQPPSNHHVLMLTEIVKKSCPKKIFLGIGVSTTRDERNFLAYKEIRKMMTPILDELGVKYEIKPIPDINNSPKYCDHVQKIFPKINENNTILYTENTYTSDCFVKHSHNYQLVSPTVLPMRATIIREMMARNENWEQLVPPHVASLLKKRQHIRAEN